MTPEAILMLLLATGTVWGGLVASIVNLRSRGSDRD
ncbi:MetS family NSS transporter small subunit [Gulosibacter macacae]|uniref:MetS family NSS transporter small subunit n=1 Tax=Gulosibacter macacae TaxID=2488791 RepID=A0A3P3W2P4_9MICO|nr:MetS family NSS transporter small subunit [Gulosibacter macacae]RRJ88648.1 MetS family NSS transporter small subunit [Gulosibacter macacae]